MSDMTPDIEALSRQATNILTSLPAGIASGKTSVGLYGLGFLGRWALSRLKAQGTNVVACYDANTALHGTSVENVPVHPPILLETAPPDFVFIAARHAIKTVSTMLDARRIAHMSYDAWRVASDFASFRRIHDCVLQDARSRQVLRAVVMAMLTGDERYCATVFENDQYFGLPQFCGAYSETFVDAGAFVGDSVERFIWAHNGLFTHIYAFEPGPRQFAALQARCQRLIAEWALEPTSITLVNAGLGKSKGALSAQSGHGYLTSLAFGGTVTAAGTSADIVDLDGFLRGQLATFLKVDVEGMEMALLRGARATIQNYKPKISICVYHYPTDIPDITGYLANLVPDYRFALRHHSPRLMETVLYCWTD